jgi:hypothetical protein
MNGRLNMFPFFDDLSKSQALRQCSLLSCYISYSDSLPSGASPARVFSAVVYLGFLEFHSLTKNLGQEIHLALASCFLVTRKRNRKISLQLPSKARGTAIGKFTQIPFSESSMYDSLRISCHSRRE